MNTLPMINVNVPALRRSARPAVRPRLQVRSFGASDIGREREINEDRFLVAPLSSATGNGDRGHLLVVADGMGGALAGEKASELAVEVVKEALIPTLRAERLPEQERLFEEMRAAMRRADTRLHQESARHVELDGMGTTLTLAYTRGRLLFIAHVGDSRCYLLRDGVLVRMTQDQTFVAEMVRQGTLPPERAAHHGLRHVLTSAIGGNATPPEVEVHVTEIMPGDVIMLCSDGLTEMVGEDEIAEILTQNTEPVPAAQQLIARANDLGGRDNVTAIVARYAIAA